MATPTVKPGCSITLASGAGPDGMPYYCYVLPSRSLRDVVVKWALRRDTRMNYVVTWRDANGWGVQITWCHWVAPGSVYRN